jgi:hypothetical protein
MKKILFTLSAIIAASACTATAQDYPRSRHSSAECTIDVSRTRDGVRFEALARSRAPASGQYEFILTKDDADGSSDIVQGGAFDLSGGRESVLGSSEFSLSRHGRYRATLVLYDGRGEFCRAVRRS